MQSIVDVIRAADLAAAIHKDQRRKGAAAEPYIVHLTEVARLLAEATDGGDPALVVAGLLHDSVEDHPDRIGFADIEREFGADVATLVREVTDDKSLPEADRRRRQEAHVREASDRARMLKLADKTSNLRAIAASVPAGWTLEAKVEYFEWGKRVADGCRGVNARLEAAFDEAYRAGMAALAADEGVRRRYLGM